MKIQLKLMLLVLSLFSLDVLIELLFKEEKISDLIETEKIWQQKQVYNKSSEDILDETRWNDTPSFSIIIRLYSGSVMELYNIFLMSYLLFWPIKKWSNSDLILVFDDESEKDHRIGSILANLPPYPLVYFEPKPKQRTFCSQFLREGYSRQQYSNFYSDMYSNSKYIGMSDADAYFVTSVVPEDLFIDGKPRIKGYNGCCKSFQESLKEVIGGEVIGEFMVVTGFPVIVKTNHFADIRKHIQMRMSAKSFEEAYYMICSKYTNNRYGQFDLMIHYLWNFKRTEYSWHINDFDTSQHPEFSKRMTNSKHVLELNRPITGLVKHAVHLKWPESTLDLVYDYMCEASEFQAGDCEKYLDNEIIESTQMSLLVDWTFRTPNWKKRGLPLFVRRKMYENPWELKNKLTWLDTYKIHVKNLKIRNYTKKWNKFNSQ